MLFLRTSRILGLKRTISNVQLVRKILSQSYDCSEAWVSWKDNAFCRQLQSYEFIPGVQKKFIGGGLASAVDIDIAVSLVSDPDQVKDVKDLLYKLRHSSESCQTLPSTHHAVVRNFLRLGKTDEILEMLADTINYGIFPDCFSANLLMDCFLEQQNYRDAAKVASHLMLQEEFSNRLSCLLSVFSSFMYLRAADFSTWSKEESQSETEEEDEEILFKVPWLKNPHFDDHFDLSEPKKLVGKTLVWMSSHLKELPCQSSLQLIGYSAYEKWDKVEDLLKSGGGKFHSEAIEIVQTFVGLSKNTPESGDAETPPTEAKDFGAIQEQLKTAASSKDLSVEEIGKSILSYIKKNLPSMEKTDSEALQQLFNSWNNRREQQLNNQIHKVLKREQLKAFEQQRKDLEAEEEILFFFERKEELEKQMHHSVKAMEADQRKRMATGEVPPDDEYVIPDITARQLPQTEEQKF